MPPDLGAGAAPADDGLQARLEQIWMAHLPETLDLVRVVEDGARRARAGSLDAATREAAIEAAHKLAGVCATFGRSATAASARAAEAALQAAGCADQSTADLERLVAEIRQRVPG